MPEHHLFASDILLQAKIQQRRARARAFAGSPERQMYHAQNPRPSPSPPGPGQRAAHLGRKLKALATGGHEAHHDTLVLLPFQKTLPKVTELARLGWASLHAQGSAG